MSDIFVAWQSSSDRSWRTVGRLSGPSPFRFEYTQGALLAIKQGFHPFAAFPDPYVSYESHRLFPFFANRLLSEGRPEYRDFVNWVNPHSHHVDPILLLGHSGGTRMTDSMELFPRPERTPDGRYHMHFFVHGTGHMPVDAAFRAGDLRVGERLLVLKDIQNPKDSSALLIRTAEERSRDIHFVGFMPRYLSQDIFPIVEDSREVTVEVGRVNPPPAPIQYRIMCCFSLIPPRPLFQGPEFETISETRLSEVRRTLPPPLRHHS